MNSPLMSTLQGPMTPVDPILVPGEEGTGKGQAKNVKLYLQTPGCQPAFKRDTCKPEGRRD